MHSWHNSFQAAFEELGNPLKTMQRQVYSKAAFDANIPLNDQVSLLPFNKNYEIDRTLLAMENEPIGEGEFGLVFKGNVNKPGFRHKQVAIKISKGNLLAFSLTIGYQIWQRL